MSHTCPGPRCLEITDDDKPLCLAHWNRVPVDLRRAVYATWNRGRGAGTEEYAAACEDAITAVRRQS